MSVFPFTHVISVDGGGTGCRAAVFNLDGIRLGYAEGAAANISTDLESAFENILQATSEAAKNSGLDNELATASIAVLGLAGANVGSYAQKLETLLPFKRSYVTDDRETTVAGALQGTDGCVAAIGTGSFFSGRVNGHAVDIGGWGFAAGDDGSGAHLGQDILRRTLHCHDGLYSHSDLTRDILGSFQDNPAALGNFALGATPGDFGNFAKQVVRAAEAGDNHGQDVLSAAVSMVEQNIDSTGFTGDQPLYLLGGLGPVYKRHLSTRYVDNMAEPHGDALDGAALIAGKLMGET